MIKFPSIEQFRTAIKNVQSRAQWSGRDENGDHIFDRGKLIPTLTLRGTVKLHGTNAGIVYDAGTATIQSYQSRERELTLTQDNAGFMLYMQQDAVHDAVLQMFDEISKPEAIWWEPQLGSINAYWIDGKPPHPREDLDQLIMFGEWCGGNIQKGVGISGLPKMFVYFAVKATFKDGHSVWLDIEEFDDLEAREHNIYNVLTFGSWTIDVDFNNPQLKQNELSDLTIKVEDECPAGKFFGNSGVGEGIVWQPITDGWRSSDFWFKVKGEKHSVSKVKTLAPVDTEAFQKQADFVAATVTEARLEQGLQVLQNELLLPFEMKSLGDFIRWVYNDIVKEEMDTIVANQFDVKKLGGPISNAARPWFIQKLNAQG